MLGMKFVEKLAALTEGANKRELSRAAGLREGAISDYIARSDRTPSADTGIALARVLNVDPAWLFDESQDLPPRRPGASLPDVNLVAAFRERYRERAGKFAEFIRKAERIDWASIRKALESLKSADEASPLVTAAFRVMTTVGFGCQSGLVTFWGVLRDSTTYDISAVAIEDIREESLELPQLMARMNRIGVQLGESKVAYAILNAQTMRTMAAAAGQQPSVRLLDPKRDIIEAFDAYEAAGGKFVEA